ncbi:MAG TPA: alanine--glyoxylate aminotransferase family protein [Chloroflexota bacterium]|nr:alanine--glyoxylate aminotransferase family protein [Chloroflexota bacterium]
MLVLNEADKLLMIPGPTPVQREILEAIGEPTISHTSAPMADIVRRAQEGIALAAGTEEGTIFIFSGSGTLAQEVAVLNLVAPGESLLVASNGFFGDRFVPLAEALGMRVERLAGPWGTSVTPEMLEERLDGGDFRAVTITQVETSTGVLAPVRELAEVARRHGALVIVDAVCGLGGVPLEMDAAGIDVVLSGAQKALGVPPGLSILAVSPRALERRRELGRVAAYYADLLNWLPSMENPQTYFSTHAVNLFYALAAGVEILREEGLENRFVRHRELGATFRAGMDRLGFVSLTDPDCLSPTMSVLAYPDGLDDSFLPALSENGVVAAACLGEFKGRGMRFGHMGNSTQAEVLQAVEAVERTMRGQGLTVPSAVGAGAAE